MGFGAVAEGLAAEDIGKSHDRYSKLGFFEDRRGYRAKMAHSDNMNMKMRRHIRAILGLMVAALFIACQVPTQDNPPLLGSTIEFADGVAVTKMVGSGSYTNAVSGEGSGALSYRSESPAVATVDANSGATSLVAAGTTVISVEKAATETHTAASASYTLTVTGIGSAYQGGIIAYILQEGDPGYVAGIPHGIIATEADLGAGRSWALPAYQSADVPEAYGTAIGMGFSNTVAIVAQNGAPASYAAGSCAAYVNLDTGTGGYSDWYLPSIDELGKLYLNRNAIGGFGEEVYWSSSAASPSGAWRQSFSTSTTDSETKDHVYRVRPVRSF